MRPPSPSGAKPQQTTRRCHWVPQAYLKAWAVAPGNTPRIWRLSKLEGEPELKRVDKVAVKHHLYTPRDASGQREQTLEKKLSRLEQLYTHPLWHDLQTGMVDLGSNSVRDMVSLLAATMYLRTPEQLKRHQEIHKRLVEAGMTGVIEVNDPNDWERFKSADEDGIKRMWMSEIDRSAYYANLLKGMRWSIIMSDPRNIITSDNPITFNHPSLKFRGIRDRSTSIMFPLSPTRMLMMDHVYDEPHNQYYHMKHPVAVSNLLLWRGSTEFMFSNRHPDEVCRELEVDAEAGGFI